MKELIAYINSTVNNSFNSMSSTFPMIPASMGVGYANGYVAVPKDHPFFGKGYDEVGIEVHGGLTFACSGDNITVKSLPETEVLEGCLHDLDENWWVFGFDTCHYGDSLENWTREAVIDETLSLKKQLEEAYEQAK